MEILYTFGQRAKHIMDQARAFATCASVARTYIQDTPSGPSTPDYDLLQAAKYLEDAARDLRQLHARLEDQRGSKEAAPAHRIPVHTYGH